MTERAIAGGLVLGRIRLPRDIAVRLLARWQALSWLRTLRDLGLR